ncbi:MAG: ribonuclease PH [Magnetovibrio sp.]|nr:ribonuclease PH [Magnetovibrio sp.]|tara:strand:+ start:106 stop:825 length:720 start_codon:yes stop_codon:yes gene_type:complete
MRASGRKLDELRNVVLEPDVSKHAEGSCLAMFGDTQVLCTASVENRVPSWLRDTGQGWITAEYGMLPRSTNSRIDREAARGKQSGRTLEIQRLIGRSLRAVTDLKELGEIQIKLDCDVIQADGGTRTAAITGAFIALYRALIHCQSLGLVDTVPIIDQVAAISCGLYKGRAILDLDYEEDSNAEADANFVLTGTEQIVEIQSTAETTPFTKNQFFNLLQLAQIGIAQLIDLQKHILKIS